MSSSILSRIDEFRANYRGRKAAGLVREAASPALYHGTTAEQANSIMSQGFSSPSVWLTDSFEYARHFGDVVIECQAFPDNPLESGYDDMWAEHGHDALIYQRNWLYGPVTVFVVAPNKVRPIQVLDWQKQKASQWTSTWDKTAMVTLYHVSPVKNRESILQNGLQENRHGWLDDPTPHNRVYGFQSYEDAYYFGRTYLSYFRQSDPEFDIWRITLPGDVKAWADSADRL